MRFIALLAVAIYAAPVPSTNNKDLMWGASGLGLVAAGIAIKYGIRPQAGNIEQISSKMEKIMSANRKVFDTDVVGLVPAHVNPITPMANARVVAPGPGSATNAWVDAPFAFGQVDEFAPIMNLKVNKAHIPMAQLKFNEVPMPAQAIRSSKASNSLFIHDPRIAPLPGPITHPSKVQQIQINSNNPAPKFDQSAIRASHTEQAAAVKVLAIHKPVKVKEDATIPSSDTLDLHQKNSVPQIHNSIGLFPKNQEPMNHLSAGEIIAMAQSSAQKVPAAPFLDDLFPKTLISVDDIPLTENLLLTHLSAAGKARPIAKKTPVAATLDHIFPNALLPTDEIALANNPVFRSPGIMKIGSQPQSQASNLDSIVQLDRIHPGSISQIQNVKAIVNPLNLKGNSPNSAAPKSLVLVGDVKSISNPSLDPMLSNGKIFRSSLDHVDDVKSTGNPIASLKQDVPSGKIVNQLVKNENISPVVLDKVDIVEFVSPNKPAVITFPNKPLEITTKFSPMIENPMANIRDPLLKSKPTKALTASENLEGLFSSPLKRLNSFIYRNNPMLSSRGQTKV